MRRITTKLIGFALLGVLASLAVAWLGAYFTAEAVHDTRWLGRLRAANWKGESKLPRDADRGVWLSSAWRAWGVDIVRINNPDASIKSIHCAGWPQRCLWGATTASTSGNTVAAVSVKHAFQIPSRKINLAWRDPGASLSGVVGFELCLLPWRPMWAGLALNAAVFGSSAWLLSAIFISAKRLIRRVKGQCPTCGYPVGLTRVCAECGSLLPISLANRANTNS